MRRFLFVCLTLAVIAGCDLHPFYELAITPPDGAVVDGDATPVSEDAAPTQDTSVATADTPTASEDASASDAPVASDSGDGAAITPDAPTPADASVVADGADASVMPTDGATDVPMCPAGFVACAGACVDTQSSATHCGACGRSCGGERATMMCLSGACAIVRCAEGYADCDGNPANGCEASLTSPDHCAVCSNACAPRPGAAPSCATGMCAWTCTAGFADCNRIAGDGCEVSTDADRANCGACGHECGFAQVCTAGRCVADLSFQPVAPCLRESDYVRASSVAVTMSGYSPRCIRVARGTTVTFADASATHPMFYRPNEGTEPSPLAPYVGAVATRSVNFPDAGYFPFRCTLHEAERGVVWVE